MSPTRRKRPLEMRRGGWDCSFQGCRESPWGRVAEAFWLWTGGLSLLPCSQLTPLCGPQTPPGAPPGWEQTKGNVEIACNPEEWSGPPRASRLEDAPTLRPIWIIRGRRWRAEQLASIRPEGQRIEGRWEGGLGGEGSRRIPLWTAQSLVSYNLARPSLALLKWLSEK